ncbi:hypothetical protein DFJ73DRAFT_820015 [Zopfochytrium polystomum]|nr:hypothetical protein DFJ73DRAFT_820015 [Zopfochytrium polystomum]
MPSIDMVVMVPPSLSSLQLALLSSRPPPPSLGGEDEQAGMGDDLIVTALEEAVTAAASAAVAAADTPAPSRSPRDFLLMHERGVYTVGRILVRRSAQPSRSLSHALAFRSAHVRRLRAGIQHIRFGSALPLANWPDDLVASVGCDSTLEMPEPRAVRLALELLLAETRLERVLDAMVAQSVLALCKVCGNGWVESSEEDIRITLLVTCCLKTERVKLAMQCTTVPKPSRELVPCNVALYGTPRKFPTVKDTLWIRLRAPLEDQLRSATELILSDHNGNLHEGLTTNFFCGVPSSDGGITLQTAPMNSVLPGTLVEAVLSACAAVGVQCEQRFPRRQDSGMWAFAFLTSAGKLMQPVAQIDFRDGRFGGTSAESS